MRIVLLAVAMALLVAVLPVSAQAVVQHYQLNIQRQPLDTALKDFAHQTGLQVARMSDSVDGTTIVGPVKGELSLEEGLNSLLDPQGLSYRRVNERMVAIVNAGMATAHAASKDLSAGKEEETQSNSFWDRFRLAQLDQGTPTGSSSLEKQAQDQNTAKLEEVVVTAQKRKERLIDVPISIAAVSGDELQQRQITTLEDLQYAVPDLHSANSGITHIFEIRGVSNQSGNASLVGLYIDESDVTLGGTGAIQINPVTFDLDRVEVLRGPQGTLYGEGSAGGAIHFITKSPNLSRVAFDSQVTALFTEGGDPSQRINAMMNIPLIEDRLALRIATTYEHDGGWIDQPAAGQKHINGQDLTNLRIKGLWQPDPRLTVSAMAIINRNNRSTDTSDSNAPTEWTQVFNLPATPRVRSDYDLYTLTTTYDLSSVARILNTVSYLKASATEWNQGFSYPDRAPPLPPDNYYAPLQKAVDHVLTDELRLTSIDSARWQWTVGGFFRHYRDFGYTPLNYFGEAGPPGTSLPEPYAFSLETLHKSWSAFGDASYQLLDSFTIGAGVRYFQERQDANDDSDPAFPTHQDGTFHSVDPRIYARLKVAPGVNIYASAAKGFRSGGFTGLNLPAYGPESVWTYELGAKMAFLDGRVRLDTAVFSSSYADFQTYGTSGNGFPYVANAGRARIKGIESDLTWVLLPRWRVEARGDYLNGRFTEVNPSVLYYVAGDPLDQVPRYQFTLSDEHEFTWLGKQVSMRLDYSQQGPETSRNRYRGPWYYSESDVIQMLNFHAGVSLQDNLRVGFVAQNLLDDQGFVNTFNNIGNGVRPRPRTFGIDFSVSFE